MNPKVAEYISKKENWRKELEALQAVFSDLPVEETIKWGAPTYVYNGKNIVGLAAFKNYCGLWFFQGSLLKDKHKVFVNAQEGKTKAMLQWRFSSLEEIDKNLIKAYVLEAIENVKLGKEIKPNRTKKELIIPEELQKELNSNKHFKEKFEAFSNSYKREYANYISEAKREATRVKRLQKIIPMILNGAGLHDKYKNC
ncbi:YdeI/OmpD-associated family protein [Polaribacter batillariae]|uniref:YdeI/OmpD-associated family protein n=1 Tax=Polaribacter batillariae TaxID=2808900 RepID=A0ABX7STN3_9FLAO|nr:YdeI/OmpD-associated family protein [Polaribacter batillariae]QTD37612.1 YdeI/OmpD-associated family protein [Polaribacter batillariae]